MKKVIYSFTNIAPSYRTAIWSKLLSNNEWEFNFVFGTSSHGGDPGINFDKEPFIRYNNRLHRVENRWLKNKKLIWQKGVIGKCVRGRFDQAIFFGEMHCLSTWIAALICRIRGMQVTFWGHGLYGDERFLKLHGRKIFYRLAGKILLYERRAKRLMVAQGFNPDNIYVVFNSLDYYRHKLSRNKFQQRTKKDVFPNLKNPELPVVVFIGRLTKEKKLGILIDALTRLNSESETANLILIGDGVQKKLLEEMGSKAVGEGWLHFAGACYDEDALALYLSHADLCVSPGNVGLTAVHSLSYGVPVGTHDNFCNQGPEAGTIEDGYNGFFFRENDTDDLKAKIENWLFNNREREHVRERCYEIIDKYYNPDYQLSVFNRLINGEKPEL